MRLNELFGETSKQIITGNIFLIICCIFYLAWWVIAFKPEGAIKGMKSGWLLMPSLFEPCGLSQLMSLRYGTVPIVRETGGLKDTVEPYNEYEGKGTGFSFMNFNAHDMLASIRYAMSVFWNRKREWNKIIDRGMAQDFSWQNSARAYTEMYDWLVP